MLDMVNLYPSQEKAHEMRMLQRLAKIQKCSHDVRIMPVMMSRRDSNGMALCGVMFKSDRGVIWYDFEPNNCKLLSGRAIRGTDNLTIRNTIHDGGLYYADRNTKISVRLAR